MAIFDTLFNALLGASFVVAPLGGIAAVILLIGLWRSRREPT